MPHVSKYKLSRAQVAQLSQRVVDAAFLVRNRHDLQLFFGDLLSITEKIMLGKRLLIALMLERGYSYLEIRRRLGVSDPTIASVSERLRIDGRGFRSALKQIERRESIKIILEKFGRAIESFSQRPHIRL